MRDDIKLENRGLDELPDGRHACQPGDCYYAEMETENASLTAKLKEAEAECERLRVWGQSIHALMKLSVERNAALVEALGYYANESNWGVKENSGDDPKRKRDWYGNGWHGYSIAEAALAQEESK